MEKHTVTTALIIALGIAIAGISVGMGFYKGRSADRYVNVKGLAEREVRADLAIWPITCRVTSNDLTTLHQGIDASKLAVTRFLAEAQFPEGDISFSVPRINDTQSLGANERPLYRYIADVTITVRSKDIDLVKKTMQQSGKLIGKGVVLAADNWQTPTEFLYTGLNAIKPEMIEEATKDARRAAEKFARDSGSEVGKIRTATQGYFSITDRDRNSPEIKQVRVVTTVEYFLVD
jgi:hypothetical protein